MTNLTGKQRRFLRGLGQKLDPACIVGKAGLSEGAIENISLALSRHELIKIRLPGGPAKQRRDTAERLAQAAEAECVAVLGRTALLYRPSDQLGRDRRITLP